MSAEYDESDERFWEYYSSVHGVTFPEKEAAEYIYTYVPPVLLVAATVGNLLSAIVLRRIYGRVLSTMLYVFVLVLVELLVLYVLCGNVWLHQIAGMNVRNMAVLYNNSLCKIYPFMSDLLLHLSTWMCVAMAVETALVTMQPPRLLRMCNLERARAVILLIVVLLVCLNAHCFWSFALVSIEKTTPKTEVCTTAKQGNQNNEEFRRIIWPILDIVVADLLPYCIIFSCTVVLLTKRVKRKDQMKELDTIWKSFSIESDSARQFHGSVLAICICYVVLLLAKLGNNIFHFLADQQSLALVQYSLVLESRKMLADAVCSMLHYTFLSCTFFVLLATSARFRHELFALITCQSCCACCCRGRGRRGRPHCPPPAILPAKCSQQALLLPVVNNHNSSSAAKLAGADHPLDNSLEHVHLDHHNQNLEHVVLSPHHPHHPNHQAQHVHPSVTFQDQHTTISLRMEPYIDNNGSSNNHGHQIYSMTSV